ncbi:TolC family protein, partial [Candidatus Omnitrophota bacterium]
MKYSKFLMLIVVFVFSVVFLPHAKLVASPLENLSSLVATALQNNPQVQSAYHKWKASEAKIKHVKSLPDPMVSYVYFGENVQTRVGPQEQKYAISQKIPFPGKLKLKAKAQISQAKIFEEKYKALKDDLIKNVKFAYYDLLWIDKALLISVEEKEI